MTNAGVPRICHVCSGHRDDDDRVFEKECMSIAEAGYDVHLVAASEAAEPYVRHGVTIHPVPVFRSRRERILAARRVSQLAASLHADLYHVHEPELLGPVLKRAAGKPVVWDVHEPYVDHIPTKHWIPRVFRPLVRVAWDQMERWMVRRCAAVVPVTEWLATRYRSLHERVVVAANFPRLPEHDDVPSVERRLSTLVFTGCLSPDRGISEALQAMAILQHRGVVVSLELAGPPITQEYYDGLMHEARELGVHANVIYHGVLSRQETARLQQTCGIGLAAHHLAPGSRVGYPVKMFEFMMYGLPLVFADLPSFQSVAGESNAGIAVDPMQPQQIADAIERLVADPELARRLGENGKRAIYQRYNWNAEWPKLQALYRDLIGPPGPNR